MNIEEIVRRSGEMLDYAVEMRRHFHRHPEPTSREFETVRFLCGQLDRMGISYVNIPDGGILGGLFIDLKLDIAADHHAGKLLLGGVLDVHGAHVLALAQDGAAAVSYTHLNFSLKAKRGSYELTAAYTNADGQLIYKTIDIKAPAKDLTVTF